MSKNMIAKSAIFMILIFASQQNISSALRLNISLGSIKAEQAEKKETFTSGELVLLAGLQGVNEQFNGQLAVVVFRETEVLYNVLFHNKHVRALLKPDNLRKIPKDLQSWVMQNNFQTYKTKSHLYKGLGARYAWEKKCNYFSDPGQPDHNNKVVYFATDREVADLYSEKYFCTYQIKESLNLFELTHGNLEKIFTIAHGLAAAKSTTETQQEEVGESFADKIEEVRLVTGTGLTAAEQRTKLTEYYQRKNWNMPHDVNRHVPHVDGRRLSLHDSDKHIFGNFCRILTKLGFDGYHAGLLPRYGGKMFYEEIAVCSESALEKVELTEEVLRVKVHDTNIRSRRPDLLPEGQEVTLGDLKNAEEKGDTKYSGAKGTIAGFVEATQKYVVKLSDESFWGDDVRVSEENLTIDQGSIYDISNPTPPSTAEALGAGKRTEQDFFITVPPSDPFRKGVYPNEMEFFITEPQGDISQ